MATECLSCGYLNSKTELNCPQCGSFYTKIINPHDFQQTTQNDELNSMEENNPKRMIVLDNESHD